jgi:hypothetical protein
LFGEKRGFVSSLSKSPLGQRLVPRNENDKELFVELKLFLANNTVILVFRGKQGDKIIWWREGKERRDEGIVH